MKGWIEIHDEDGATFVQVSGISGVYVRNGKTIIKELGFKGMWIANESYDEVKELIAKSMQEE